MKNEEVKEVETLIEKAAKAEKSEDAMRFSQAAVNVTNAMTAIKYCERDTEPKYKSNR